MSRRVVLRSNPQPTDEAWVFTASIPETRRPGHGKHVSFTPEAITLDIVQFPSNRVLRADDMSKCILASFENLRFPDQPASTTKEYMIKLFKNGFFINGTQYRFYGHSNSQLVGRACSATEEQQP